MMTPKQHRRMAELETRIDGHGELIKQQHNELLNMDWKLFNARAAAFIGWAGLLFLAYQSIVSPVLECRL